MTKRTDWRTYFLNIADGVAVRADCTRRKVGAVVVDPVTWHIIATGYNGSAPGEPGCLSDNACPRGRHYRKTQEMEIPLGTLSLPAVCACGNIWPCPDAVDSGSSYDTGPGACIALHAEQNATIRAGILARGSYLYLTDEPCGGCWKLLKGAGYARVIWHTGQWTANKPQRNLKAWRWMRALARSVRRLTSRSGKRTPSS